MTEQQQCVDILTIDVEPANSSPDVAERHHVFQHFITGVQKRLKEKRWKSQTEALPCVEEVELEEQNHENQQYNTDLLKSRQKVRNLFRDRANQVWTKIYNEKQQTPKRLGPPIRPMPSELSPRHHESVSLPYLDPEGLHTKWSHVPLSQHEWYISRQAAAYRNVVQHIEMVNSSYNSGLYEDTIEHCKRLMKMAMAYNDLELPSKLHVLASCLSCIGNSYLKQGHLKKALNYHMADLNMATKHDIEEAKSRSLDNLGRVYARMEQYDKASSVWLEKIPLSESQAEKAWLCHEIGHCYLETHQYEHALDLAHEAMDTSSEAGDAHWQLYASVLLAEASLGLGDVTNANKYFKDAKDLAKQQGDDDAERDIETALSMIKPVAKKHKKFTKDKHRTP